MVSKTTKLDNLDTRIVNMLMHDSAMPAVRIARSLDVTEGTVRNRIRRLIRLGVIKRFTISIEAKALGITIVGFVLLNTAPGRLEEISRKISVLDSVQEIYEIHTYGDLLIKIRCRNLRELADIVANKIKTISGVIGTQVITVMNVWKESS